MVDDEYCSGLVSIPNLEGHPVDDTLFRVQKVKKKFELS